MSFQSLKMWKIEKKIEEPFYHISLSYKMTVRAIFSSFYVLKSIKNQCFSMFFFQFFCVFFQLSNHISNQFFFIFTFCKFLFSTFKFFCWNVMFFKLLIQCFQPTFFHNFPSKMWGINFFDCFFNSPAAFDFEL